MAAKDVFIKLWGVSITFCHALYLVLSNMTSGDRYFGNATPPTLLSLLWKAWLFFIFRNKDDINSSFTSRVEAQTSWMKTRVTLNCCYLFANTQGHLLSNLQYIWKGSSNRIWFRTQDYVRPRHKPTFFELSNVNLNWTKVGAVHISFQP